MDRIDETMSGRAPASRRGFLAAGLGGLTAWAVAALGRPATVHAEGENVQVGGEYLTATSVTRIANQTINGADVFRAENGSGVAMHGISGSSVGVQGVHGGPMALIGFQAGVLGYSSAAAGVRGESHSGSGVQGQTVSGTAVVGLGNSGRGVWGQSTSHRGVQGNSDSSFGVYGRSNSSHGVHGSGQTTTGVGVYGESSAGTGVFGISTNGYAFKGSGRVRFDKISGVSSIPAGSTSVTITPGVDVTADSFLLLTPKANIGSRSLYFSTDATNNRFTIRMSSSRTSATSIAWLLLR